MRNPTIWVLILIRSDTNWAVQSQEMVTGWEFGFRKKRNCTIPVANHEADLRLCFRLCRLLVFPFDGSYLLLSFVFLVMLVLKHYLGSQMGKPRICISENKGADQLRSNCETDQRFCFRYTVSTIPLLSESKISSLQPSPVTVQAGLCGNWLEPKLLVFSCTGSFGIVILSDTYQSVLP